MVKSLIKRKIWDGDGAVFEDVLGYKFHYSGIDYGVYNSRDYDTQYSVGYVPILISDNEDVNGLSLSNKSFKTIKDLNAEMMNLIDEKKSYILARIRGEF